MKKGDIVLIPFPFTDLTGVKNRPALILIESDTDVTVSFITTQLRWFEPHDVNIEPTYENGLKSTSLIRLNKITTIDKDLVIGKLGKLTATEIEKVNHDGRQADDLEEGERNWGLDVILYKVIADI